MAQIVLGCGVMAGRGFVTVPFLCAVMLATGPGYAEQIEPGLAVAVEKARSRLAADAGNVAEAVRPSRLVPRRVRLVRVSPAQGGREQAAVSAEPAPDVEGRLDAVFSLVAPLKNSAQPSEPRVRVPVPRPTPDRDVIALAYAAGGSKQPGSSSGLNAIESLVEEHAAANDIPPALAHALVQVESSYNPKATGRNGEIGLLQIKPQTARRMGYKGSPKGLYDPETNLAYGMKYLGKAHDLADGDTCGTLLRFNAGLDAKRKSAASNKFCAKVKRAMAKRA